MQHFTAPQLFGLARHSPETGDSCRCFFCGGKCGPEITAKSFVKSSFTSLDTVTLASHVCRGCVASQEERTAIEFHDGETREGQRVRGYSWLITSRRAIAATKTHRAFISSVCCDPSLLGGVPYVISLADSGQKHLLYRAVVCHDELMPTVTLEGERITYRTSQLSARLELCRKMAAAIGKPTLTEPITPSIGMRAVEYYGGDDSVYFDFVSVQHEPLTRLAAWLCPPMEECQHEFPRQSN